MSATRLEALLAQIYVDDEVRARFLTDPAGFALKAGLSMAEAEALNRIDKVGLELMAESLKLKRLGKHQKQKRA